MFIVFFSSLYTVLTKGNLRDKIFSGKLEARQIIRTAVHLSIFQVCIQLNLLKINAKLGVLGTGLIFHNAPLEHY